MSDDLARYYQPTGQLAIVGDDWTSDRDRNAQAKRETARKRAGLACVKKLRDASEALSAYLRACNDCRDGSGDERRHISDGRHAMIRDLNEYAGFLESKYDR